VKNSSMCLATRALPLAIAAGLLIAPVSFAQTRPSSMQSGEMGQREMTMDNVTLKNARDMKLTPEEEAAYKSFYSVKPEELDKKIQLGQAFLQRFPQSVLAEPVDAGLMNAYYAKQDWKDVYQCADNALTLKPDDVDVLTTVGWLIPHLYNPNDADADSQLDKAERFEKHAIEVIPAMPKPSNLTDAQFAAAKAQKAIQAHSALGLVYFRREDYDKSAKELQQTTVNNPAPDQTDLFVLGVDLQNLNRFAEAADAFGHCSQIAGAMQDRCKQSADEARKKASLPK
jgi:tetratricopeptide (TPR) repeat protein